MLHVRSLAMRTNPQAPEIEALVREMQECFDILVPAVPGVDAISSLMKDSRSEAGAGGTDAGPPEASGRQGRRLIRPRSRDQPDGLRLPPPARRTGHALSASSEVGGGRGAANAGKDGGEVDEDATVASENAGDADGPMTTPIATRVPESGGETAEKAASSGDVDDKAEDGGTDAGDDDDDDDGIEWEDGGDDGPGTGSCTGTGSSSSKSCALPEGEPGTPAGRAVDKDDWAKGGDEDEDEDDEADGVEWVEGGESEGDGGVAANRRGADSAENEEGGYTGKRPRRQSRGPRESLRSVTDTVEAAGLGSSGYELQVEVRTSSGSIRIMLGCMESVVQDARIQCAMPKCPSSYQMSRERGVLHVGTWSAVEAQDGCRAKCLLVCSCCLVCVFLA